MKGISSTCCATRDSRTQVFNTPQRTRGDGTHADGVHRYSHVQFAVPSQSRAGGASSRAAHAEAAASRAAATSADTEAGAGSELNRRTTTEKTERKRNNAAARNGTWLLCAAWSPALGADIVGAVRTRLCCHFSETLTSSRPNRQPGRSEGGEREHATASEEKRGKTPEDEGRREGLPCK